MVYFIVKQIEERDRLEYNKHDDPRHLLLAEQIPNIQSKEECSFTLYKFSSWYSAVEFPLLIWSGVSTTVVEFPLETQVQ